MNKFMGGFTLGIVCTACVFIIFTPFQKKIAGPDTTYEVNVFDTLVSTGKSRQKDSAVRTIPNIRQTNDRISRDSLVLFAKTLIGTPYLYGSTDPAKGFDCSGFITYVFNHFKIVVPRSSFEFAELGKKVSLTTCRPGDLILFTGTDPLEQTIGHIGIISDIVNGSPDFIHSSSGKAHGVTVTSMNNKFYQDRFIAVVDILFPD